MYLFVIIFTNKWNRFITKQDIMYYKITKTIIKHALVCILLS